MVALKRDRFVGEQFVIECGLARVKNVVEQVGEKAILRMRLCQRPSSRHNLESQLLAFLETVTATCPMPRIQ